MGREGWALALPWMLFPAVELWFAYQGFNVPDAKQAAMECAIWVVVGLGQARLAQPGWARSPLWAGVLPLAWVWFLLGPRGGIGLVHLIGTGALAVAFVVRAERARPFGVPEGVLASFLSAVLIRYLVLAQTADGAAGTRQTSVANDPKRVVLAELTAPLHRLPERAGKGPPVVLITVDTLRADHGDRMKAYARLAERGASWTTAVSTSSWTVPAVASALTGRMPGDHGAGVDAEGRMQGLDAQVPTLATALSAQGYRTAGFTTNAWLTSSLGFSQGFDEWWHCDEDFHHLLVATGFPKGAKTRDAQRVVDRAISWLEERQDVAPDEAFFLWVHLLDPHLPYGHPEGKLEAALSDEALRSGLRLDAARITKAKAAYQREVDYADAQIVRLLDALQAHGVLDDGVVVLTADHGEELWDHGGTGHGHTQHREVVQIPLVIAGHGMTPGVRADLASLLDVPSTLAAVAGTTLGVGRDLRQPVPADRVAVSQGNVYFRSQRSAWEGTRRSLVLDERADAPSACYDLVADPTELSPMACAGDALETAAREAKPPGARDGEAAISKEALKALGYLE